MYSQQAKPRVEEVESILTPADGISLDQAVLDANLSGYDKLFLDRANNRAVITWYKRADSASH